VDKPLELVRKYLMIISKNYSLLEGALKSPKGDNNIPLNIFSIKTKKIKIEFR